MMKKLLFALSILVLAGCNAPSAEDIANAEAYALINFEEPSAPHIDMLERNKLFADTGKVAKQMELNAIECGWQPDEGYFPKLVEKYAETVSFQYGFQHDGDHQGVPTWWITMIPNVTGYDNMEDFRKDFNVCNQNRGKFPYALNEDWLMLVASCGAPHDDESGRPKGCITLRDEILPTLELAPLES